MVVPDIDKQHIDNVKERDRQHKRQDEKGSEQRYEKE
jgi:hypothetical protein